MNQRVIKFRAWDKFNGEMYESKIDLVSFFTKIKFGEEGGNEIFLMQYTGLKDKTGKEIYEGDLVVLGNDTDKEFPRQIIWRNNGFFCQQIKKPDFSFPLTFVNISKGFENSSETDWEIIGNIYDTSTTSTSSETKAQ